MDTLKLKNSLEEHSLLITDVRFSPNSTRLATSSFDKTVRVWDADNVSMQTSTSLAALLLEWIVQTLCFLHQVRLVTSGSRVSCLVSKASSLIYLPSLLAGYLHIDCICSFFSCFKQVDLIMTLTVGTFFMLQPSYSLRTFTGHQTSVMSLDFHPNNEDLLCSCDGDSEIRYWSVNQGSCTRVFKVCQTSTHIYIIVVPRLVICLVTVLE